MAMHWAQERGWQQLTLVTQPAMRAAHRIYERAGFRRDPGLDFVVGDGLRLLGFSLDLSRDPGSTSPRDPGDNHPEDGPNW